jgi:hypothetical protein
MKIDQREPFRRSSVSYSAGFIEYTNGGVTQDALFSLTISTSVETQEGIDLDSARGSTTRAEAAVGTEQYEVEPGRSFYSDHLSALVMLQADPRQPPTELATQWT